MHTKISIDNEKCKHDGLCVAVCPNDIFTADEGATPTVQRASTCCLCGQCLAVCPSGAIIHNRHSAETLERITDRRPVAPDALLNLLRQRRSVRVYKDKPVERGLLQKVVQTAGLAPTGAFEGVGWVRHVTVVSGQQNMHQVRDFTAEYMGKLRDFLSGVLVRAVARWHAEARAGRMTLPDIEVRLAELERGRDTIVYGAPAALFVHAPRCATTPQEDSDAAMMTMLLAAHAFGLGACWNGWLAHAAASDHVRGCNGLANLLQLPDGHKVYAAATIGYPRIKLHSVPHRETVVHWIE